MAKTPCLFYFITKEDLMEQVLKHYGSAILAVIVLLALGAILVAALTSDGYVASAFRDALEGFFSDMSALTPGNVPTPTP